MVFKPVQRDDIREFSMDSKMLKTLFELDGKKPLKEIADNLGLSIEELGHVVSRLLDLGLIEPLVDTTTSTVNHHFFSCLRKELSLAIGPIADLLIEDALVGLHYGVSDFPVTLAPELVYMLARQIQKKQNRIVFQQNMLQKLKELNIAPAQ